MAGTGVLRAAGAEFEADLAYSGLQQVPLPVFSQFERLGATHRDALNVALGYGDGPGCRGTSWSRWTGRPRTPW